MNTPEQSHLHQGGRACCGAARLGIFFVLLTTVGVSAWAADASAPTAPPAVVSGDTTKTKPQALAEETVILSPFNVNADQDVGYQAANTTAGSRLNTSLKDTAAAISPFTKEFLDDIGAITLTDLMAFASNAEPELDDGAGFNANAARRADSFNAPFRIRGQAGAVAIDLADTGVPVDLADIERVEVASGPNSVLFGNGATGGLVNLATKRASVRKSDRMLRTTVGSWANVRHEIDFNQVLRKDQLALRLFGVSSDRKGWRYWDYEDTHRLTGAVTLRPWASTTISASHGRGALARNLSIPWNAMDEITLWRAQGAKVTDAGADIPGAGTASISTVNRFTFMENDAAIYNLRNKLSSRGGLDTNDRLLTAAQMPFDYNFTGPGARYTSDFQNTLFRVEQKLGEQLVVEAAFQRNRADNDALSFGTFRLQLFGDPNLSLPLPNGGTQLNPRARQLYMENNWRPETARAANEVARVTAAYQLDLGPRFGQHRIAGLLETARYERGRNDGVIVLVDQANVPVGNAGAPENTANFLWRRHYVTEGDFRTYYMSDPRIPFPGFAIGSREFRPRTVAFSKVGTSFDRRDTHAGMLALQDYWFSRRLITTFGYRVDDTLYRTTQSARLSPTDPRVASGERVANEWVLVANSVTEQRGSFPTRTFGAVYHVNRRLSLLYNQSSNVGSPRFDRTVIPGVLPPSSRGEGQDAGFMVDLLGDERFFARFTAFRTKQTGDASAAPGGPGIESNYFTQGINTMLDHLLQRNRLTQAEYDSHRLAFSAMTLDAASEGVEFEFVANPTPNWTVRATYSYTDVRRENYFAEREPYLSQALGFIRSRDDRSVMTSGLTIEQHIASFLEQIEDTANSQEGSVNGSRPSKANLTSRYRFSSGRFKGVYLGGSFLYVGAPLLQISNGRKVWGHDVREVQLFAGHNIRLPWYRLPLRLQLNVNNVGNTNVVEPGRYRGDFTALTRVFLRQPRSYRLTATVQF